jgi:hypothetical protein
MQATPYELEHKMCCDADRGTDRAVEMVPSDADSVLTQISPRSQA